MDGTIIHLFQRERVREKQRKRVRKKTRVLFDLRKKDAAILLKIN